jgi:hypothetical protein
VRPEDLLEEGGRGDGVPAHLDSVIDLGHYRRVNLSVDGARLVSFAAKSAPVPTDGVTVRPTRLLVYDAGGRLAGVSESAPGSAAGRTAALVAAARRPRSTP